MLDLESEVMRGLGSIPTRGHIFHWICLFSCSKVSGANIGIIAILCILKKKLLIINKKYFHKEFPYSEICIILIEIFYKSFINNPKN